MEFSCVYTFTAGNGWQWMCWCHCMQVGRSSEGCETGLHSHVSCRWEIPEKKNRQVFERPLAMLALLMYSEMWSGILNYNRKQM